MSHVDDRADIVVIGAGVAGLAVAIRLAAAGRRVVVVERNAVVGGKLANVAHGGATFDVGPTLVTLPHLLEELFRVGGTTLAGEVELVRVDPQFHDHWPDGATLVVPDGADATAAAFERFSPGAGRAWRRFDERGGRIWDVATRTFLAGPLAPRRDLLRRMRSPRDLLAVDPIRTLHGRAVATFDDPRLIQWAGRYATYSGSSPYRSPATLACIPHVERRFGCWYVMGGIGALAEVLRRLARTLGVDVRTGSEVVRIATTGDAVSGVETAAGDVVGAPVVVANTAAEHLYDDLLGDERALRRVRRAPRSTSALVALASVRGTTPGVGHHNVWFGGNERAEFDDLAAGRMAADPTIYAAVPSVTDRSVAAPGCESWSLIVTAPAGIRLDPAAARDRVLSLLAARGVDLRPRIEWSDVITPLQLAARTRAPAGAIYGTSSDGRRAAFLRPANAGARRGLYLVGGSSHPGGGLPLVLTSARIVAGMIVG
jgi:phytoene desaturase